LRGATPAAGVLCKGHIDAIVILFRGDRQGEDLAFAQFRGFLAWFHGFPKNMVYLRTSSRLPRILGGRAEIYRTQNRRFVLSESRAAFAVLVAVPA
jgi:hypothetical protein